MTTTHIGIDLGTTNCAVAIAQGGADAETQGIPQIGAPGRVDTLPTLPSSIYVSGEREFDAAGLKLPWSAEGDPLVVGTFAREHGPHAPERLIHSAKSWLCNPNVDPSDALLPWQSQAVESKLSPLEVSAKLLSHIHASLQNTNSLPEGTRSIITVPASFDDAARRATQVAALEAGFSESTLLLEEPLAALYAWLETQGNNWRKQIEPGQLVLVCDVGGGTSDFSLIAVSESDGDLRLDRVAVGSHILLGGDNLDLALAYIVKAQLENQDTQLDDWQFRSLIQKARAAKETLFNNPELSVAPISLESRGSSLFASTIRAEVSRDTLDAVIVDGFFAKTGINDFPQDGTSVGLQELGLNYAADPVLPKHIAAFLHQAQRSFDNQPELAERLDPAGERRNQAFIKPERILFNGGVFHAAALRQRVVDILSEWCGQPVAELDGAQLDQAVALGAAAYGRIQECGEGIRIRAGAAHSMYIGIASTMPAIPGFTPPVQALCVVPQGMEEGSEITLDKEFGLIVGKPVTFQVFSSNKRPEDTVGSLVSDAASQLETSRPLETYLDALENFPSGTPIPVKLHAHLTATGQLELWMQHTRSDQRFKIDFDVRLD